MAMRLPTVFLEGKRLPRVIPSVRTSIHSDGKEILALMKKLYDMDVRCFDLPSNKHLTSFRELKELTEDETLTGVCHIELEAGLSFFGKPLHRFETRVISTIKRKLPPEIGRNLSFPASSSEVFTEREIDRISLDSLRFEKVLSSLSPGESPFLITGDRYGDWLSGLGRIDLLKELALRVKERGFAPIFSGQWTTFALPKLKPLPFAAYAVPINKTSSLFDPDRACDLIRKFDKPVISLNPLANGELLKNAEEAFSFLFGELKVYAAIADIDSEEDARTVFESLAAVPSLVIHKKTGNPPRQKGS